MTTETSRPGRPEVGNPVHIRLGALQDAVDTYADGQLSRADAIRHLVEAGLDATRDRAQERRAILAEAYEVVKDVPEGYALRWDDDLTERLYAAIPCLTALRNYAHLSYQMDLVEHRAANPDGEVDLLIDPSERTERFEQAHDAALRAFVFGRI